MRTPFVAWVAVGMALALAPLAVAPLVFAQGVTAKQISSTDSDPIPIKVSADPPMGAVGDKITLQGSSTGVGTANTVTLIVTPPTNAGQKPQPETLTASVSRAGEYSTLFTRTEKGGTYTVAATAPDGRGVANTSFTLYAGDGLGEAVVSTIDEGLQNADDHLSLISQKLQNLPHSPAKVEAQKRLQKLQGQLAGLKKQASAAKEPLKKTLKVPPQTPKAKERKAEFYRHYQKAKDGLQRSKAELAAARGQFTTCDDLEVVTEGLKWTSFMLNFFATGTFELAKNLASELAGTAIGKAVQGPYGELAGLTANELVQNAETFGKVKQNASSIVGAATDFMAYASSKVMESYCHVFSGPISGSMDARFYNGGQEWWTYSYKIAGRISLHYPKNVTGERVLLKGHVEGMAYDFHMWENSLTIQFPKLMASSVQVKKVIPPFDGGAAMATGAADQDEGSVAGAMMPNAFFIAVDGEATKDKLYLMLGPARTDIHAWATVIAVMLSPLTLYPDIATYDLPYKDVRFLIERALGGETVTIPLGQGKDVISGKVNVENRKGTDDAKGYYTLQMEACNPGCSASGKGPAAKPKL